MTPAPARLHYAGRRLEQFSWSMFDWAQQPYFTLVAAFIFKPYFASGFVGDTVRGQALIGLAGGVAALLIAVLSPMIGSRIDRGSEAKRWVLAASIPFTLACAGLRFAAPNHLERLPLIISCLIVAAVSAEITVTANNAMLPRVAHAGRLGKLSGSAVALGYVGGLLSLAVFYIAFNVIDPPLLGLDPAAREPDRIVGPFVAVWYAVFLIPFVLWTRDAKPSSRTRSQVSLVAALRTMPAKTRRFLLGRMLVADGLTAAAVFGGVLAAGLFDWGVAELGTYGGLIIIISGIAAWASGAVEPRHSPRTVVLISVVVLAAAVLGAATITADRLMMFPVPPPTAGDGFLASPSERVFMVLGLVIGAAAGPMQASMRAWMARLTPTGFEGRWFGLFAFSNKATAFLAPLLIAGLTMVTQSQRIAMPVIVLFLAAGYICLRRVPADLEPQT
ncbi:MFS transporter [Brevundimonas nasdae]|uniref:MFS transporter n=1 Tax=Brevundimonas nasdae TaxID=172043 RepID=UPI0009FF8AB5|nr:MFS transporter [Brevundimonas nasdae]